jgi:hypothetical protein
MTLLEFHADLTRVADSLEKIAFLLEKLVFPPTPADVRVHQATLDDLHVVSPEEVERIQAEQDQFAAAHRVVPGSPAMSREIQAWMEEQKRIHGDEWQAPQDEEWKAIFAGSYAAPSAGPHRSDRDRRE